MMWITRTFPLSHYHILLSCNRASLNFGQNKRCILLITTIAAHFTLHSTDFMVNVLYTKYIVHNTIKQYSTILLDIKEKLNKNFIRAFVEKITLRY